MLHFLSLPITKITFVCSKWMKYDYGEFVKRYWWGNPDVLGDKPALKPRCSPQNPHGLTPVSKPIFRGEWPASKRRNHGAAVKVCDYKTPRRHILQRMQIQQSLRWVSVIVLLSEKNNVEINYIHFIHSYLQGGTRWCSLLRHCAKSREGASSIPDGIIWTFY